MNNTVMIAYYLGRRKDNKKTTLFDQLVCLATRSRYSHLEYVYEYCPITGLAKCWSSSPRDGGVRNRTIQLDAHAWELYSVKTDTSPMAMLGWFRNNEHRRYDWVGAFATKLPIIKQSIKRWFCSEAIAAAMNFSQPYKHTPQSIFARLLPFSTKIPL